MGQKKPTACASLLACHSLTLLSKSVTDVNENSVVQRARLQTFRPYSEIEVDVLIFHPICSADLKLHKGKGKGKTVPSHGIKACVQRKRRYSAFILNVGTRWM